MSQNTILYSLFIGLLLWGCGGQTEKDLPKALSGHQIFMKHCKICHGADGKMGLNGAKLLPDSELSLEERIKHISQGKGAMQPYKDILTAEQIQAVAEFTLSLK